MDRLDRIAAAIEQTRLEGMHDVMEKLKLPAQQVMGVLKIPASEQPKYRKLLAHPREELDLLFEAIKEAAARNGAIDFRTAGPILRPRDIVWVGQGVSVTYDMLFEIQGLRWF